MKRILIGVIVSVVLAAGGWFGFNLYIQHRATSEVEAAFEQMRSGSARASGIVEPNGSALSNLATTREAV